MSESKIGVKRITINGQQYLKSKNNILYHPDTKEEIGLYDKATDSIKPLPEYEDDDEDEIVLQKITIQGRKFLIEKDANTLYDPNTQQEIGSYNRRTKEIFIYDPEPAPYKPPIQKIPVPLEKLPYPKQIRFNEEQQKYYDKHKAEVDRYAKEEYERELDSGEFTIYKKKQMEDVVRTREAQLRWDKGETQSRPKTRQDVIAYRIDNIREDLINETDKDKKKLLLKAIATLIKKLPKLDEEDRETEELNAMRGAEYETKKYNVDVINQPTRKLQDDIRADIQRERDEERRVEEEKRKKAADLRVKISNAKKSLTEIGANAKKTLQDIDTKKRMVDFFLTRGSYSGLDALKIMYDEAIKALGEYEEAASKISNYPPAEVQAFKEEVMPRINKLKYKIIYDLLKSVSNYKKQIADPTKWTGDNETKKGIKKRDEFVAESEKKKKELEDLIRSRFTGEEQREAIKLGKEGDAKDNIIRQHRKLIDDIKPRNYLDEKRGEKNEYGNPIGYLLEHRYYEEPYWNSPNVEKEREKFKKEQAKRIEEYYATPLGQKEQQEIADNLAKIEQKRQEAILLEEQYDFLPKQAATTPIYSIYNKWGKGLDNACWKGYEAIGMKKKGKKLVPNCVPVTQGKGVVVSLGQPADKISEYDEVYKYSNPKIVQELAKKYLGDGATIFRSTKKDKKYMVYNPNTEKWVHFGQLGYEDFTKHKDEKRRKNYLTRTANMRGDWKNDKYSANNLSRNLLW